MDRLAADDGGGPLAGPSLGEVETRRHAGRTEHLESWADEVIRQAIARGEFDHLSLAGKPIPVPAVRAERYAMLDALASMQVVLADGSGAELGKGKGSDILEHPLNAVVWLAGALAKEGLAMKPGDLISLGSFSPLLPPKPGLKATVTYQGLPGAQPVSVQFK